MAAVRAAATASACTVIARSGRPYNHPDFGLCRDCSLRPSAQPPRLRSVPPLPMEAVCATATASAGWGRPSTSVSRPSQDQRTRQPSNHHDFGLLSYCPSRPSVQPSRVRLIQRLLVTADRTTTTTSAGWIKSVSFANRDTTTTSACAATADSGRQHNHHDFGWLVFVGAELVALTLDLTQSDTTLAGRCQTARPDATTECSRGLRQAARRQ